MTGTTYLVEFDLASEAGATGVVAVTVDPGDTAHDAVIAVHNGYCTQVAVTDGKRIYRTAENGQPVTLAVSQKAH